MQHPFDIESGVAVDPAIDTPVVPPVSCDNLLIGNDGAADLYIYLTPGSASQWTIAAGDERLFASAKRLDLASGVWRFQKDVIAFYMKSASGAGPVRFVWS